MHLPLDYVPATIAEAVEYLVAAASFEDRAFIQRHESPDFATGMALRNHWSLWEPETPIKRDAVETYGLAHADDLSGLIHAWVWARVRGEPFDPQAHCQIYRDHWARCGLTSLSAGGYSEEGFPLPRNHCGK